MVGLSHHSKTLETIELDAKIESHDAFITFKKIQAQIKKDLLLIKQEKDNLASYLKQLK